MSSSSVKSLSWQLITMPRVQLATKVNEIKKAVKRGNEIKWDNVVERNYCANGTKLVL